MPQTVNLKLPHGWLSKLGSLFGYLNNRCRVIIGTPKGTLILTTTHMKLAIGSPLLPLAPGRKHASAWLLHRMWTSAYSTQGLRLCNTRLSITAVVTSNLNNKQKKPCKPNPFKLTISENNSTHTLQTLNPKLEHHTGCW